MSDEKAEGVSARRAPSPIPTIYDVARVAGVSPSAVSRALSRPGRLSERTELLVRRTAEELGFRVNPSARALPTGRTMTLALLLADITNPVVFGVVRGAERAAANGGYTLVIAESQESGVAERAAALRVASSVDGVIFASSRLDTDSLTELARIKPAVLINREADGIASVVPDVDSGVIELVDHLRLLGHHDVAYVTGPPSSWIDRRRWEALRRHGSRVGLRLFEIPGGDPTVEGGASTFDRVAASRASAIIAFNDLMAIGLLRAAQEAGVRVPEHLSIAGFDDIFGSDLTTPAITTIAAPLEHVGAQAVELLLARIRPDERDGGLPVPSSTHLIVRTSTGILATG